MAAGPAAVEALDRYLPWERGTDVRVRRSLVWFHGRARCDPTYSVAVLTEFLSEPDSRTRAEAAASLGLRGDPSAGPVLVRALLHPDREVRLRAALALGRCGVRQAEGRLAELARADREPDVRQVARVALRLLAGSGRGVRGGRRP
ncbi:HEAT repeat domain-containing protein [Kitasatospora sp. NPDC094015]|uniref:HEAT repeat domain-containing protein n=1 Tax=Kitasatospora sp. NPDC094015 TaxID=3155205 RepID=UPI00331DB73D